MTSEVEERPRLVTGGTGVNGLISKTMLNHEGPHSLLTKIMQESKITFKRGKVSKSGEVVVTIHVQT